MTVQTLEPAAAPVIELEDVSLCYRLAHQRVGSLKEYFIQAIRGGLNYTKLWALNSVSLSVTRGEVVGIVGANGAGKSSLAKVISGVLQPTKGRCRVGGTVAPILELTTGFDWELTGIENIYLNGLFLGHSRREIDEEVDGIIDFSGVGDFIDSPMRNYSSGMVARLGFACVTAWIPDVLILDEVLAVGDARFVARCERRIDEFRDANTTILLISHSLDNLRRRCTRCLWIDHGRLIADGETNAVIEAYAEHMSAGRGAPPPTEVAQAL